MIRSMTGYGRASFRVERAAFDIEARSVNHRYLDVRVRLPRLLASLEGDLRERVERHSARGKLDLNVASPDNATPGERLVVDLEAAREYLRASEQLLEGEDLTGELRVSDLLAFPGVARFVEVELPLEQVRDDLLETVDEALAALDEMRATEGAALERDLLGRLERVEGIAASLEERGGVVQKAARERLHKRAKQLEQEMGLLDEARLYQEIVIAADRLDFAEELVRLRSHVDQFRAILGSADVGSPVGRRLDFLMQELGREANTIGSKGADAEIAHQIVELKTELERIREQVQNVE